MSTNMSSGEIMTKFEPILCEKFPVGEAADEYRRIAKSVDRETRNRYADMLTHHVFDVGAQIMDRRTQEMTLLFINPNPTDDARWDEIPKPGVKYIPFTFATYFDTMSGK